jgi:putative MATE family efflux protein
MPDVSPLENSAVVSAARKTPPGILDGPIAPMMLRLAGPTVVVLVVQTLVFPVLMLMQMMSNGGIGGGVSSAVARALGADRREDADALVWHSIVLAVGFGLVFTAAAMTGGSALYRVMGGTGPVLRAALTYSTVVFAGSVPIWIVALLSSALRGAGNVKVPALVILSGVVVLVPLSPALIFGWGPFPRLGVAGGAAAVVAYYLIAVAMLIGYLRSAGSPLRLKITRLSGRLFRDVLGVGLLSAIGTIQANLTVGFVTAAVGRFGAEAIAGYGIASRLDYLQIPILFGLGTAVVTMVGINVGAEQMARARRIAWVGAVIGFGITEAIGLLAATFPYGWLGLFSHEPAVLSPGALYLRTVAPAYGAIGLGMTLYFASQGAKHVLWPVLSSTVRMIVAAFIGWLAVARLGASLAALFDIVALSAVLFGSITSVAILAGAWGRRPRAVAVPRPDPFPLAQGRS